MDRFYEIFTKTTNNKDIALEVGRYAPFSKASGAMAHYLAGFITPGTAYSFMGKLYPQVSRSCVIETKALSGNQVEINVRLKPGVQEKPYQCENRRGSFEGIAKRLTGKAATVLHPVCLHNGGDHCEYRVSWENTRSATWRRVSALSAPAALLLIAALLLFSSSQAALYGAALLLFGVMVLFLRTVHLENRELKEIIRETGNVAENLLEQINVRYSNAILIKDIGQIASSILDTDQLLRYILSSLEKNLDFSRGLVLLANADRAHLQFAAGYGYTAEQEAFLKQARFSLENPDSRGPFVVSFRQQTPFLIHDVTEIEKDLSPRSLEFARKMESRSFICVPIVFEGRSEGVLAVDNLRSARTLNETDISLLMGIAPQIGISINNVSVYEKLREREKRFRTLAESAPDIIFTLNTDNSFTYVNPAWERIMQHRAGELAGVSFVDFVQDQDRQYLRHLFQRLKENRETLINSLLTMKSRDGEEHHFSFHCAANRSAEGHADGFVGTMKDMTDLKRSEIELKQSYEKLQMAMSGTIRVISLISESRDPYTAGHQRRVADLASAIAREMGFPEERIKMVHTAGLIHDIGKINVPAEILSKPGRLHQDEFSLIKHHPQTGFNILDQVDFIPQIAQIIYQHHEKLNGTGYPRQLSGDEIALEARIIMVADVVEAMAGHRPYRPGLGIEKAMNEINLHRGVVYDSDVVDACIRLLESKRFRFDEHTGT